ncbi:hypothetical protein PG991_016306 [Apiospora marii]|uniref:Uncharacterized protein n=1 Tax=Apiospora marii TaxID=335849 RepID=A0ABR1QZY5_9PEZI
MLGFSAFTVNKIPLDERGRLVQKCRGETIEVGNFMSLMPSWLKRIHLQTILNEAKLAKPMQDPHIFMLDGEIDLGGDPISDDAGTGRICDQTLQCIGACLRSGPESVEWIRQ